jgi:hypothetical protein
MRVQTATLACLLFALNAGCAIVKQDPFIDAAQKEAP